MKYEALIYNKRNNVASVIKNIEDKYYGYSITNNGIDKVNKNILFELSKILFCNSRCKYIENYEEYQVFYDEENDLKHFIKDGKEDLDLFIRFNTSDYIFYLKKNKEVYYNRLDYPKKLSLKDYTLVFTKGLLLLMFTFVFPFSVTGLDASQVYNTLISLSVYDLVEELEVNIDKIDKEECFKLINESQYLSDELKNKFANEDLYEDVFPYYENTNMEYFLRDKLTNLQVRRYGKTNLNYYTGSIAFYTPLNPNALYDKKDNIAFDSSAGHEYIHLLQAPFLELDYIVESTAVILHYEYFDIDDQCYGEGVKNIRLLMDVIGPKIIFQYIFSGNISPLENVLKNNLSKDDYKTIMSLLVYEPDYLDQEQHKEIENIIGKLYSKLNNKDIRKDINIYYPTGEFIDGRIYCNRRKMQPIIMYGCSKQLALDAGIITENVWYVKKIPDDKLEEYRNDPRVELRSYTVDLGYLKEQNVIFVKKEDLDNYAFLEDFKYPFKEKEFNYPNVSYSMDATDKYPVKIKVESIAKRFPDEMVDTLNNNDFTKKR